MRQRVLAALAIVSLWAMGCAGRPSSGRFSPPGRPQSASAAVHAPSPALLLTAKTLFSLPRPSDLSAGFIQAVEVDPQLSYYQDRTPESIAEELRLHDIRDVRYVLTADSNVAPRLLQALQERHIRVWYATFMNGVYPAGKKDLPPGWQDWRMVRRAELQGGKPPDFTYLCLNDPDYRAWKKRQIGRMLRRYPFAGVDLIEPYWPDTPGPESDNYGCFCPHCAAAFHMMFPEETALPDTLHAGSPRSPSNAPALWRKWLQFRRATVTGFLDDLVNGPGGIRATAPKAKICIWTLALQAADGVRRVREDNGQDAAEIARVVRPDVYCFETHWPDWSQPDLPPDYVLRYKPFLDQVQAVAPGMPVLMQADTGSDPHSRRSEAWIRAFEAASRRLGAAGIVLYEYSIGAHISF
ncbi:MAG TPA: hypothetical protein VKU00_17700 [Chthonomonadaceae bacterium]|nr:hypothetical protein [Chthonomonadaceae bacterium]